MTSEEILNKDWEAHNNPIFTSSVFGRKFTREEAFEFIDASRAHDESMDTSYIEELERLMAWAN